MVVFSIVVPVYNVRPYLEECIESVRKQTYPYWELLLIDDGSTDGSFEICKRYADMDKRIVAISGSHRGVGSARNLGIDIAKGKYVTFLDSDDWFDPDYLDIAFKKITTTGVSIYRSGLRRMPTNTSLALTESICASCQSISEDTFVLLIKQNYITSVAGAVISRLVIGDIRFDTSVTMGEDMRFVFDVLRNCPDTVYADSNAYYNYRMREGSLTAGVDQRKMVSLEKTYLCLYDEVDFRNYKKGKYKQYISERFFTDIYYLNQLVQQSEVGETEKKDLRLFLAKMNHKRKNGFSNGVSKTNNQLQRQLERDISWFNLKRRMRKVARAVKRRLFRRAT